MHTQKPWKALCAGDWQAHMIEGGRSHIVYTLSREAVLGQILRQHSFIDHLEAATEHDRMRESTYFSPSPLPER